jgi:hypothetical protein
MCIRDRSYSQNVELTGVLIIGKSETTSYRISYQISKDNTINGYSVSDVNGVFETKAKITGIYNPKKKTLNFEEKSIISTKSKLSINEFCFLSVKGKFTKKNNKHVFTGNFTSKPVDHEVLCDSGTIYLATTKEIYELEEKVSKILDHNSDTESISKIINTQTDTVKTKPLLPPPPGILSKSSETVRMLQAGSTTHYALLSDTVRLDIFDDQREDGDKITVLKNGSPVLIDILTKNKVQSYTYIVDKNEKEILFTFISTDEGSLPPCTIKVYLINGKQKTLLVAPLKKGEMVKINLHRTKGDYN